MCIMWYAMTNHQTGVGRAQNLMKLMWCKHTIHQIRIMAIWRSKSRKHHSTMQIQTINYVTKSTPMCWLNGKWTFFFSCLFIYFYVDRVYIGMIHYLHWWRKIRDNFKLNAILMTTRSGGVVDRYFKYKCQLLFFINYSYN